MGVERLLVTLTEISATDFDLTKTLESGQVFHWEKIDKGFGGTIGDQAVYVEQRGDALKIRASQKQLDRFKQSSWSGTGSEERIVGGTVARYFALDGNAARRLPRIVLAALIMGILILCMNQLLAALSLAIGSELGRIVSLALLVAAGLGGYLAGLQALGVARIRDLLAAIRPRI